MAIEKTEIGKSSKRRASTAAASQLQAKASRSQVGDITVHRTAATGLLSGYRRALSEAKRLGQPIRMTVLVEPKTRSPKIAMEAVTPAPVDALDQALAAARNRGATRVAEILSDPEMLSADDFAGQIGATRETVNKKRHRHEVLGLEGPKRGVRFPRWQLSPSGELLPGLPQLFAALNAHPWAVYRFLLNEHAELGGITGLAALRAGRVGEAVAAVEAMSAGSFV